MLLFDVIELELVGQLAPARRHFVSISVLYFYFFFVYFFYLVFYATSWREYANFQFVQHVVADVAVTLETCWKC